LDSKNLNKLKALQIENDINYVNLDLTDIYSVYEVIKKNDYDEIYNLAAQSFVGASWDLPQQTTMVNAIGALNILESIKRENPKCKFYQASTSEMFGKVTTETQSENTPFYPRSPYGISKLYAHWTTVNYRESFNIHANSGILFNHESPLRGHNFVTKKISSQLARIKVGKAKLLKLGNLDAKRDWGHAEDYVRAMWMIMQNEKPDDFVIATGESHSVRDFVNLAAEYLEIDLSWQGTGINEIGIDMKTKNIIISIDSNLYRPAEVDTLKGDYSKAKLKMGWKPTISFDKLVKSMVDFDYKLATQK
jgi:GDPmannose 4,6-dehydratase